MRLIYGSVTVADESRGDLVETDHDFERDVEVTSLPDSTAPSVIGRDNHRTELSFRVTRIHASAGDCSAYLLDLGESLPVQGDLRATWGEGSGRGVTRYLNGAVITGFRGKQVGKSSTITLQFTGGRLARRPSTGATT